MKIFLATLIAAISLSFAPALVVTGVSYADAITDGICATDPNAAGCPGNPDGNTDAKTSINKLVKDIISIFSWVVGVISVIMVIFGGFKYITSAGDSNKVTSAKNTIIYALVGLVIAALAQVIVLFVLGNVT